MSADGKRHIVTLGGGGFSMEPKNPLLDDYILRLTGKRKPRICFLPTASAESEDYIGRFYKAFPKTRATASHLLLFRRDATNLRKHLLSQDVIYVGGGNTANMLAIWRVHGVDNILRQAWKSGIVLTGVSAGMICWYECSCTDSFGPLAALQDGLGFLKGGACPHYDGEARRRPTLHKLIRAKTLPATSAADDGAAFHWIGTHLHNVITSRPKARAYRVELQNGRVVETELPCQYLGASK